MKGKQQFVNEQVKRIDSSLLYQKRGQPNTKQPLGSINRVNGTLC